MKLIKFRLAFIKSYRSLTFDFSKTRILVGQNDHGKSSILKILNIVFNEITDEMIKDEMLSPDVAEKLLTIFNTNAKARRISLVYLTKTSREQELHISIRPDFSFVITEIIKRNISMEKKAISVFREIRKYNKFILIPAMRDATSNTFKILFSSTLDKYGLANIIPKGAGGTTKEYRKLKNIKEDIQETIKPFVDEALIPKITKTLSFKSEHPLTLSFDADVNSISEWIRNNLKLSFKLDKAETATLPLSEAGSGIQSAILLALHQLEYEANLNRKCTYFFAIEEPESFLHPQKQKELFQKINQLAKDNVNVLMTTHSPFIVSEAKYTDIAIIRKKEKYSSMHVPKITSAKDKEIFNAFSNEINSHILYASKVIFVEGDSDRLVLRELLRKVPEISPFGISIISGSGNRSFSPYIKMIRSWENLTIPHLIVTDFDSLTKDSERAIIRGLRGVNLRLPAKEEETLLRDIDSVVDKSDKDFETIAKTISEKFKRIGVNLFIFTSDLEYSLVNKANIEKVHEILHEISSTDYSSGYSIIDIKKQIGSKGIPLNPLSKPKFKKPYIHKKIAATIEIKTCHNDIKRLISMVKEL